MQSMQNWSFRRTRWRLAAWSTGVMTLILILCGLVVRQIILHARWIGMVQEMQALASTLEDYIEPALKKTGEISVVESRQQHSLDCKLGQSSQFNGCEIKFDFPHINSILAQPSVVKHLAGKDYCFRLLDASRHTLAAFQSPLDNPACSEPMFWRQLKDSRGEYYHNSLYPLYVYPQSSWGALQIAASMNALDMYLMQIEILLVILVLLGAGLIGFASWWLAGLAMRPIGESYQQMQQFTADAAHELRTPLASLRAIVQTALRSEPLTIEEAKEALQILNRQSQRLSKLVQDLLILSQADQSISMSAFTCCCLNSIVQEAVNEFMAMAMAANLTLVAELECSPLYTLGDSEQIYRAVSNLITNAIQYTLKGKITVIICRHQAMALIKVCDTGIGIAPEAQRHIFDRFYRVEQVRSHHKGGSGLGLAITKAIAEAHQGNLSVESQPNQGSIFTLALPLLDNIHQSNQAFLAPFGRKTAES